MGRGVGLIDQRVKIILGPKSTKLHQRTPNNTKGRKGTDRTNRANANEAAIRGMGCMVVIRFGVRFLARVFDQ